MTAVLVTVDTEMSSSRHGAGWRPEDNLASGIFGRCAAGDFGILHQMDQLEAHGLKGVFFVDPLPALVLGEGVLARIVDPIVARGHEVQLHIHTEWLDFLGAGEAPVAARGRNIGDFTLADQMTLLETGADLLVRAGASRPVAFRAGNFGANDDTLRALAAIGLRYDSSFNPAYLGRGCDIGLPPVQAGSVVREGVVEVPVAAIHDLPGRLRPLQLCALSSWEMRAALAHAATLGQPHLAIVTHSFELLSRDRRRPNRRVIARFDAMCAAIGADTRLVSAGFRDLDGVGKGAGALPRLPANPLRTAFRIGQQALATLLYERRA